MESLPSCRRESTAVHREGLRDASTAHPPQQVTYEVPDDFPERLERFKEESGLSWAEIIRRLDIHHETMRRWSGTLSFRKRRMTWASY